MKKVINQPSKLDIPQMIGIRVRPESAGNKPILKERQVKRLL